MPIRAVKQYSDRGKLKNLEKVENPYSLTALATPAPSEVRFKKLYDFAKANKDNNLQAALGIITTDYIEDKNALPLSIYRLRQIVADIKSKSSGAIDEFAVQLIGCMSGIEMSPESVAYWNNKKTMRKIANVLKSPSFWRASKL